MYNEDQKEEKYITCVKLTPLNPDEFCLDFQILNQPLAPQTLLLLNQLLQQIKNLQQLNSQHQIAAQSSKGNLNNPAFMQYSVLITKTKQQIMNIQVSFVAAFVYRLG